MFRRNVICAEWKFSFIFVNWLDSGGAGTQVLTVRLDVRTATPDEFHPSCGSVTVEASLCVIFLLFLSSFIVQRHPAGIDAQIGVPKPLRTTRCPVVVAPATTTTAVEREE
jgi:hypothetical protein